MAEERSNYSALAQLINAIVTRRNFDIIEQFGMSSDHIHDPYFKEIYETIKTHVSQYGEVPTVDTLLSIGGMCADFAANMYQPEDDASDEFIRDKVWEDHIYHVAADLLQTSADYVNADPKAGIDYLKSAVSHLTSELNVIGTDIVHDPSSRLSVYHEKKNNSNWFYPTGFAQLDEKIGGFAPGEDLIVLFARTGVGKEQPLYSKVLTPSGWKRMGDINLGEYVITATGESAPVIGVFPQGVKPVYRIWFHDGTFVDAGIEHLWKVEHRNKLRWKSCIVCTQDLIKNPDKFRIACAPSVDFRSEVTLSDAHSLGCLIGASESIYKDDVTGDMVIAISEHVNEYAQHVLATLVRGRIAVSDRKYVRISSADPLYSDIDKYLSGCDLVYLCDEGSRLQLLRGICDVSGQFDKRSRKVTIRYIGTSRMSLIRGLINSLGGVCYVNNASIRGEIYGFLKVNPFSYIRPRTAWKPCEDNKLFKKIDKICEVGTYECQCIMVDHPDHTYITDNYTVTHNTWIMTKMLHESWKNGYNVGLIEPEMTEVKIGYRFDTINRGYSNRDLMFGRDMSAGPSDYDRYIEELPSSSNSKFMVSHPKDFNGSVTVSKIKTWCVNNDIKILGIDGISYMQDERGKPSDSATMTLTHISADLMELSIELGIPILIVVQSNREGTAQGGKLALENIRDSDGIAYSASKVIGLYKKSDALHIQLLKNRDGESDACLVYDWDINLGRFQFVQEGEMEDDNSNHASQSGRSYTPNSPDSNRNVPPPRPDRMSASTSYENPPQNPAVVF